MGGLDEWRNRLFLLAYLTMNRRRMTKTGGDWNPNDPLLQSPRAPHETAAALRLPRAGYPGPEIAKLLKLKGTKLMHQLQQALDQEGEAHRRGVKIHDSTVPKGTD
jgi:hypothetical protein